jgi:hypothetical protein
MRYFPIIICIVFAGLVGFRYYTPTKSEPILKPEKLVLVQTVKQVETSYDTTYAQYLRRTDFKQVLRQKDWITRVESSIAAQDRLILFYHNEIMKRRKLLNIQVSELAKLNNN